MVGFRWSAVVVLVLLLTGCGGASVLSGSDEGSGSSGRTFGFITAADPAARTIDFDAAEWLTGDQAAAAALADGRLEPGQSLPNDYYIRNPDQKTVVLHVAPNARVHGAAPVTNLKSRPLCESCPFYALSVEEFFSAWKSPRPAQASYWVTTRDGDVVAIEEQYRP